MKVLIVICVLAASLVGSILAEESAAGAVQQGQAGLSDQLGKSSAEQQSSGSNSTGPQVAPDSTSRSSSNSNGNHLEAAKEDSKGMFGKPNLKEFEKNKPKEDLFQLVEPFQHFFKFLFEPVELAKNFAVTYRLNFEKLNAFLGKNFLVGLEAMLAPVFVSIKLVEKMFVTDSCSLRFVCKWGAQMDYMKGHVSKMPTNILEGTGLLKAFTDGVIGKDCELVYAGCGKKNSLTLQRGLRDEAGLNFGPVADLAGAKQTGGAGGLQLPASMPTPVLVPVPAPAQMMQVPDVKGLQQQMDKFIGGGGGDIVTGKASNGGAKNPLERMNDLLGPPSQQGGGVGERKDNPKLFGLF